MRGVQAIQFHTAQGRQTIHRLTNKVSFSSFFFNSAVVAFPISFVIFLLSPDVVLLFKGDL